MRKIIAMLILAALLIPFAGYAGQLCWNSGVCIVRGDQAKGLYYLTDGPEQLFASVDCTNKIVRMHNLTTGEVANLPFVQGSIVGDLYWMSCR